MPTYAYVLPTQVRYQGVDWLDSANWKCNAETDPHGEFAYDGVTLDPYETVFARLDTLLVHQGHPAALAALKYDQWTHVSVNLGPNQNLSSSIYVLMQHSQSFAPAGWALPG